MADTLFKSPRCAPKKQNFIAYCTPQLHNPFPPLPDRTDTGEYNLFGIIKQLILPLQNQRQWKVSTCHSATRLLENHLYRQFSSVPFAAILEEDLCALLTQFENAALPDSTKQRLKFLVKVIFQLAFDQGLTATTLWGIPEWSTSEGDPFAEDRDYNDVKHSKLAALQKRKLDQLFGTGRSVSPAVELVLFIDMLCSSAEQGELIAGLIIWICGTRPAEACNLKYKHFRRLAENVWSFTRADINDSVDGKNNNASRHLILPYFFARFIQARVSYLLSLGYTQDQINEMYIACPGQNYSARDAVSTTQLNRKLKAVYYRAGVAEDLMAHAYTTLANNKDVYDHCSGSSSAYLGRHQAATEFYGVGLPLNDCALNLGHAKIEGFHQKTDFSRADVASKLYDKLRFRPVVYILDSAILSAESNEQLFERGGVNRAVLDKSLASLVLLSENHIPFSEISSAIYSDLPANVSFDSDTLFQLAVIPDTPNEELSFSAFDIDNLSVVKFEYPISRSTTHYTSVQKSAVAIAVSALSKYRKEHLRLSKSPEDAASSGSASPNNVLPSPLPASIKHPLVDSTAPFSGSIDSTVPSVTPHCIPAPFPPAAPSNDIESNSSNTTVANESSIGLDSGATLLNTAVTVPLSPLPALQKQLPPEESNKSNLYLMTSRGLVAFTSDSIQIGPPGRNGLKCPGLRINTEVFRLLAHNPELPMYVISADSTIHKIPPCKNLLEYVDDHQYTPACKALLSKNGITLQSTLLGNFGCNLLFLSQDGYIRLLTSSALTKLEKASSIQLFTLLEHQRIVSVCCLSAADESLLLTATNGDALRIPTSVLHAVKAPGAQLIRGMVLNADTHALACLPGNHENLITISSDGKVQRVALDAIPSKTPGKKSTQLMACTSLAATTAMSKSGSLLLCTNTGYLHCIAPSSIPEGASSGLQAITFRAGRDAFVADAMTV